MSLSKGKGKGVSPVKTTDSGNPQRDLRGSLEVSSDQFGVAKKTDVSSIFTRLEDIIITFVKEELRRFQKVVSTDQPEDVETRREGEEAVHAEDEEERKSKEAFLKITQHFLRSIDEDDLADSLQKKIAVCQRQLKSNLRQKCQRLSEDVSSTLCQVYTELFIREKDFGEVNCEHEIRQIESSIKQINPVAQIRCEDIFIPLPGSDQPNRTVMTCGVSGIGKTVFTRKFILDWAEDKANQDIEFTFPFTFQELNLLKGKKYSMVGLLHNFFSETKEAGIYRFDNFQVLFILDGLDEYRLPLDFHNNEIVTDVTESTSVDVLLTNLIRGKLLPSARLWITTRPSAASRIPRQYVDLVTEVRGFSDPQKEEYFRRKFRDKEVASRIISHIKTSRTLYIMCHIPLFCDMVGKVLEDVLTSNEGRELPNTMTAMYIHFLLHQSKLIHSRYCGYDEGPFWYQTKKMILSLGKLAFEQLEKGNLVFYEEDLRKCGIDTMVYSGLLMEIFKEERALFLDKMFCFVHLSIQEFLAALYVFLSFNNSGVNRLSDAQTMSWYKRKLRYKPTAQDLYQRAVDKALESQHGHLDLFLRFLLGFSLETNQALLHGLLKPMKSSSETIPKTVRYIKEKIGQNLNPEKNINLFHCLNEMDDQSLMIEMQQCLISGSFPTDQLSPAQWSALVFILLTSEQELNVFDLKKYSASEEGLLRTLPVVKASSISLLNGCNLTERGCEALASVLSSTSSNVRELDLSNNDLADAGVKLLTVGLKSPQCRLKTLRLNGCNLTERSGGTLALVLRSPLCSLRQLDLSNNGLDDCGVVLLSKGLESPNCELETLGLSGCRVTEIGCAALTSALSSNPSHLRELDLSCNHPGDSGVKLLTAGLMDPHWRLETLRLDHCGEQRLSPRERPAGQLKIESFVSATDSSEWIEVEPVVNTVDDVQTYSFQSDAGRFEYSVCGLRWVCNEKVHFTYQYCSWQEHTMKPSCMDYMPAGPLLDITVRAGKLEEVQLPHWICVDDISKMSDAFRVLHVETCGEVLEKVSEVTSSRVKLLEPTFSPIGVMIRKILGFPVRVFYDTLIYKTNKEFLTLDVYLVPPDPALQQKVEKKQNSCGSVVLLKPGPENPLQMGDNFSLTTDNTDATIQPSARKLRDDGRTLFEVFLRNADSDFTLRLESGENTVWTCSIHKGDYQGRTTDRKPGQHFVDLHRTALINRVSETGAVLDGLKDRGVISSETYDAVSAIPTTRDRMRRILTFVTTTTAGKDALYEILKSMKSMRPLLNELEGSA